MLRLPVSPAFEQNNLAITLQTSDFFAPYASVTILSIIENTSPKYNYDILVMTWDMTEENAQKLISMAEGRKNISIRVVDVSNEIIKYQKLAKKRKDYDRFSSVGVVRLSMPSLLEKYDHVLSLDSDLLICADVSELFRYDLSDCYMGGVSDLIYYSVERCNMDSGYTTDMVYNRLKLDDVSDYLNAGLFILNLQKIREDFTKEQIIDFAIMDGQFCRCYEQDTFNGLFRGKKLKLPMEWNWYVDGAKLIARGKAELSATDELLESYYQAESCVKNYHYLTKSKPWTDTAMEYADRWWNIAWKSPFFDTILSRIENSHAPSRKTSKQKSSPYLLFLCETSYQLMNVLNLKYHYYPNVPSDLILCSSTDVIRYESKLEDLKIFNKIITSTYDGRVDWDEIEKIPVKTRTLHPEQYEHMIPLEAKYSDLFIPIPNGIYHKMIFYTLVKKGRTPSVHIFEDGGVTYTEDIDMHMNLYFDHQRYRTDQQFPNNVTSIFLYRPDLYCGKGKIPRLPIPQIDICNTEFAEILHDIFGEIHLPKAKYLFFDEWFAGQNSISNDIEFLDMIAEIVGKDNIAIKMHPRSIRGEDIYRLHGYNTFSDSSTPWEMAVYSPQLEDKVLMSVSSNTVFSPFIVAGKKPLSISFFNIMRLSRRAHARTVEYSTFLNKIRESYNKEQTAFYIPRSLSELKSIIYYIEGES